LGSCHDIISSSVKTKFMPIDLIVKGCLPAVRCPKDHAHV
jgi:hypothetical protein